MLEVVWVVMKGERYEGGSVYGIFATAEKAYRAALGLQAYDYTEDYPWVEDHLPEGYPEGYRSWSAGCDYITVQAHELK